MLSLSKHEPVERVDASALSDHAAGESGSMPPMQGRSLPAP